MTARNKDVLIELYKSCGGRWWHNKSNWNGGDIGSWDGVATNDEQCVVKLSLNGNGLKGSIPTAIGDLAQLTELDLGNNELSAPTRRNALSTVDDVINATLSLNPFKGRGPLPNHNIVAAFPAELSNLSSLRILDLSSNKLTGSIPQVLGGLKELEILNVSHNKLLGSLGFCNTLTKLKTLELHNNIFEGEIPPCIGTLSSLVTLNLSSNRFCSSVPASLWNLPNLEEFDLSDNLLEGTLVLRDNQKLQGPSKLTKLKVLKMNKNLISGAIPVDIGYLSSLVHLDLSANKFNGTIPLSFANIENMEYLSFGDNSFDPVELTTPDNEFLSKISKAVYLKHLDLRSCALAGQIPDSIGALQHLLYLDLRGNNFSGPIPKRLGELGNLRCLNISMNQLSGSIPVEICNLTSLVRFFCFENLLSGEIPSQLGNMVSLQLLNMGDNKISGRIPDEMGNLVKLKELSICNNFLEGKFPTTMSSNNIAKVAAFGNPNFNAHYRPWLHRVTTSVVPTEIKSTGKILFVIGTALFAYVDVVLDCIAAYVVYSNGQYWYFSFQLFFFLFPAFYLAVVIPGQTLLERLCVLFQLRLAIETYQSIQHQQETVMYLSLKFFEAVVEAIPSSMLQLTIVLTSPESLRSSDSTFLLLSTAFSVFSVACTLRKAFPVKEAHKEMLSDVFLLLHHAAEVLFRVVTFVALFISVGGYGLILLALSVVFRFILVYLDSDMPSMSVKISQSFIASVTESLWYDVFESSGSTTSLKSFSYLFSIVDGIIAFIILFTAPDCHVPHNRRVYLLTAALLAVGVKLFFYMDSWEKGFNFNRLLHKMEVWTINFIIVLLKVDPEVKKLSTWRMLLFFVSALVGYADIIFDLIVVAAMYSNGQHLYFSLQLLIYLCPTFFLGVACIRAPRFLLGDSDDVPDAVLRLSCGLCAMLQLPLAIGTCKSILGQTNTDRYFTLTFLEAIPSAILQLTVAYLSSDSLLSGSSRLLVFSASISIVNLALSIHKMCVVQECFSEVLSEFLLIIHHASEVTCRIITFVAAFVSLGPYGLFFLATSFLIRCQLNMKLREGEFIYRSFIGFISSFGRLNNTYIVDYPKEIAEGKKYEHLAAAGDDNKSLSRSWYLDACDLVVAFILLFQVPGSVPEHRKVDLVWSAVVCFSMRMIFYAGTDDDSFMIHRLFRKLELFADRLLSCAMSALVLLPQHVKEARMRGDLMYLLSALVGYAALIMDLYVIHLMYSTGHPIYGLWQWLCYVVVTGVVLISPRKPHAGQEASEGGARTNQEATEEGARTNQEATEGGARTNQEATEEGARTNQEATEEGTADQDATQAVAGAVPVVNPEHAPDCASLQIPWWCTLFQLRFAVGTFKFINNEDVDGIMEYFYLSFFQSGMSSVLQLTALLRSWDSLHSRSALIVLVSVVLSVANMALILRKKSPIFEEFQDKISEFLMTIHHTAEVTFRVTTFVALFASVGVYGFILGTMSFFFRLTIILAYGAYFEIYFAIFSGNMLGHFVKSSFSADEAVMEFFYSAIDCLISFILLFTVPSCPVPHERRLYLLYANLIALLVNVVFYSDSIGAQFQIHSAFKKFELHSTAYKVASPDVDDTVEGDTGKVGDANHYGEKGTVRSKYQALCVVLTTLLAYGAFSLNCAALYCMYLSGHRVFLAFQIAFLVFPVFYITATNPDQFGVSLLKLRFALEAYKAIEGEKESPSCFETIYEAIPSSLLQLTMVCAYGDSLSSTALTVLLLSTAASVLNLAFTLHEMLPVAAEYNEKISISLLIIYHIAEITHRVATFAALFASVHFWGIFLLVPSFLFRLSLFDRKLGVLLLVSESLGVHFLIHGPSGERASSSDRSELIRANLFCAIDCLVAFIILFTVPDCPVPYNYREYLLSSALVAFGVKVIFNLDTIGDGFCLCLTVKNWEDSLIGYLNRVGSHRSSIDNGITPDEDRRRGVVAPVATDDAIDSNSIKINIRGKYDFL